VKHIDGIDHIGWLVRELDATAKRFNALGFTLSPRQTHSANMGSANHTFLLGDTYVELTGFIADTEFNLPWRRRVTTREGLYIASARTNDAVLAAVELRAAGLQCSQVVNHSRPATLIGGETVTVAFDVVYVDEDATAPLHVSICHHRNPELIFIPQLSQHANTAVSLRRIYIAAHNQKKAASRCALLFGGVSTRHDNAFIVETRGISIVFKTAEQLIADGMPCSLQGASEGPAGVCFEVASVSTAAAVLERAGIKFESGDGRILVSAREAAGCFIEFHEKV